MLFFDRDKENETDSKRLRDIQGKVNVLLERLDK
jgi:hypothetical protein